MIDLTVLIPSYDTRAWLLKCLESVESARRAHPEIDVEVIVVDNGSSDASAAAVREGFPGVRLLALARNRGFAAAVNRGLQGRRGRSILLLNSDVEIDADLLAGGVRLLDAHPDVGVIGASLVHPDGRPQRSIHRLPGLETELLPEWLLGRATHRRSGSPGAVRDASESRSRPPPFQEVEAVRGAVFFLRGSLLAEVGGFNEGFFFFLEETEYCARVRRAGYRVVSAPSLLAVHGLGASSKRRAPLATRIEFHRSLYRYLELERGRGVSILARGLRSLRGGFLVLGMVVAIPFSPRIRERLPERWGLLLWHLRGCPAEPCLVDALETSPPEAS